MMMPINWGNNVDVQRALHFDLDPLHDCRSRSRKYFDFCRLFLLTGSSLCSLLLRNYSTDFSNDDTNHLREQCRCATCTSIWPWPPPWLQVKITKYFDFVNYFCWRVVVCVRFSSETTRPISPMMIPINWGNNVDVQRALHFDLDPLHDCRSRSRNTLILWIIFADR